MLDAHKGELKKHVAMVHCANKLTLVQRKIANALLYNAFDDIATKDRHEIPIRHLCSLIGYDSHDYKLVKKALVALISTVLEWNLLDGEKLEESGVWNASAIIADASIQGPICSYSYSHKMRQLLSRPEIYARLNMGIQAKFKSSYGLALYENCVRYQKVHRTPWLELDMLRKLMGVTDNKYPRYKNFKQRVIDTALNEVNLYSNLNVSMQEQRVSRRVSAVQFSIHDKVTPQKNLTQQPIQNNFAAELTRTFGLTESQALSAMKEFSEDYIGEKIKLVKNSKSYIEGKINHLGPYLLKALKEDFQPEKNYAKEGRGGRCRNDGVTSEPTMAELIAKENQRLMDIYLAMNKTQQTTLCNDFAQGLGKSPYRKLYEESQLDNVLVRDQLCIFLRAKLQG